MLIGFKTNLLFKNSIFVSFKKVRLTKAIVTEKKLSKILESSSMCSVTYFEKLKLHFQNFDFANHSCESQNMQYCLQKRLFQY